MQYIQQKCRCVSITSVCRPTIFIAHVSIRFYIYKPFTTKQICRGGSGLIFLGPGQARVESFGLLKFKIGLEAFKSWALITGLKIC
jgi:hypothetical protein